MKEFKTSFRCRQLKPAFDLVITLILWVYFTAGFVLFFSPFYLLAFLFSRTREQSFQRLNHRFYKGFFKLLRILVPATRWHIPDDVLSTRSSVIVCNHISYLDSILMISLFEQHRTIVKSRFFSIPIFRQVIELSGYIPSTSEGNLSDLIIRRVEEMDCFFKGGGNLFIFPEGTRSRSGAIGRLNKGAFKIARLSRRPIKVLFVHNTEKLFQPGRFLFNSCFEGTISVEMLAGIEPDYQREHISISELMTQVRALLETEQAKRKK
ncbi:MAG: lysophospholipid acyltransferase family protein [Pseudomonadota bacterium]